MRRIEWSMKMTRARIIFLFLIMGLIAIFIAGSNDPSYSRRTRNYVLLDFELRNNELIHGSQNREEEKKEPNKEAGREEKELSILGKWLRSPEGTSPPQKILNIVDNTSSLPLLILVWKYGPFLEKRHIRRFSTNTSWSPWKGCSVKDCRLSYLDEDLSKADAVLFHLHLTKGIHELPPKRGKHSQIWIFMTDESPLNTFLYKSAKQKISDYDNIFDWSMTYKIDSDVPVAYGRTITRKQELNSTFFLKSISTTISKKIKLVAIMGSNCSRRNNQRWKYVRKLKELLGDKLSIYGKCLNGNETACPGHFDRDCPFLASYKFYLAFENSNCREYLTEKVYWNAYKNMAIPVVMGAPRRDYARLLPPKSFIHVDEFSEPARLVDYILYLNENDKAYAEYHEWRSRYIVLNEHGYFGSASRHYCRICEALHYNRRPLFDDSANETRPKGRIVIGQYWNKTRDCDRVKNYHTL